VKFLNTIGALCVAVLAVGAPVRPCAQQQEALLEEMIRIVVENNPTLESQRELVLKGEGIPVAHSRLTLSGASVGLASTFWSADTGTFEFTPGATLGLSFAFADPARALSRYNLEREKAEARRRLEETRNGLIGELLDGVAELVSLDNKKGSLRDLQAYLEDLGDAIERQGKAGIVEPDKLWDLRERIMGIRAEVRDVENRLQIVRLQTARTLGGPAWQNLLDLLARLGGGI
jgi:outer membrane protein TolC